MYYMSYLLCWSDWFGCIYLLTLSTDWTKKKHTSKLQRSFLWMAEMASSNVCPRRRRRKSTIVTRWWKRLVLVAIWQKDIIIMKKRYKDWPKVNQKTTTTTTIRMLPIYVCSITARLEWISTSGNSLSWKTKLLINGDFSIRQSFSSLPSLVRCASKCPLIDYRMSSVEINIFFSMFMLFCVLCFGEGLADIHPKSQTDPICKMACLLCMVCIVYIWA